MSTGAILQMSETALSDLGVNSLVSALNFTQGLGGGGLLRNSALKPSIDRVEILRTQEAVAALVKSWQTVSAPLQASMKRAVEALHVWKEEREYRPSAEIVGEADKFLGASTEAAALILGAINVWPGSAPAALAEIQQSLALNQTPMLKAFREATTAQEVTFGFHTTRTGTPTATRRTVTGAGSVHRDWKDPSHAVLADHLWIKTDKTLLRDEVNKVHRSWAALDRLFSLAGAAVVYDLVRPEIVDEAVYDVEEGVHPLLRAWHVRPDRKPYDVKNTPNPVPNTIYLGRDQGSFSKNTMILTGPNSGGKTSLMQQVGLTTIMAMMGSFVPAAQRSTPRIGIFDRIETLFGASGSLGRGGAHVMETKIVTEAYGRLTSRTLALLDEPYRNTEPESSRALTHATVAAMGEKAAIVMASTHHMDRLDAVQRANPNITVMQMGFTNIQGQPTPTYQLLPGATTLRGYGVVEAKRAGLPPEIAGRI